MDVVVASHPSSLAHDTGPGHPERPDRVHAVVRGLEHSNAGVIEVISPEIDRSALALVHDPSYIEMVQLLCSEGGAAMDIDTVLSSHSWEAALTAAGGLWATIEELGTRGDCTGFVVSRPPGHHALPQRAMGFCIFNNVAVSASLLRGRGERVAILDWDVHHGNGTQAMVMADPGVLYVSLHQRSFYPYEGDVNDIDLGDAPGTTINIPLAEGTAGDLYRKAWGELVLPVVRQFEPDWVLISGGYDGHVNDPLAGLQLQAEDYGWISSALAEVHPTGRTVVALEGGYDLTALEESAKATINGFSGSAQEEALSIRSPEYAASALTVARDAISRHWEL